MQDERPISILISLAAKTHREEKDKSVLVFDRPLVVLDCLKNFTIAAGKLRCKQKQFARRSVIAVCSLGKLA